MAQLKAGSTAGGEIIATRDWVTSTLIDGAPAALDTLNELAAAIGDNASYAASITTALAGKLSTTGTAADSSKLGGIAASSYWRSGTSNTWSPSTNILLPQSANNQEWSFDVTRNGYTGGYWQVWDSSNSTMLKVDAVNGKVYAPYGFVGDLTGNITGSAASATTAGSATTATTATNLGSYYTADNWFRSTGDNNTVKFYGNSRMMVFRTDGEGGDEGHTGYAFKWTYGGNGTGNSLMLLDNNGNVWTKSYGWLHSKFDAAGAADGVNNRIDDEIIPLIAAKQDAGSYLTTTGKAADSNLLDGIDSSAFLRSNANDSFSGQITMSTQKALIASDYGHGVYGVYSASKYQHVWSMGTAYNLPANGDSSGNGGNLYGLAWSYNPNYGYSGSNAQSKSGLNHQLLLMMNGVTHTALGSGIWTNGTITTSNHGNSSQWNTAYSWGNHAGLYDAAGSAAAAEASAIATVNDRIDAEVIPAIPNAFVSATVSDDTITFTKADGTTQAVTTSDANTNTWRPIDDTPVDGATTESISSNWAYDHANATNPHGITLAALGYTGATNANYITNNNQLTNGAGYLTSTNDRVYITDSRGAVRAPSYYNDRYAQWDFQNVADTGVGGDGWHALLTVSKWSSFHDSHRQEQLIFSGDHLWRRTAISDSEWGDNKKIWDSGNFDPGTIPTNNSQLTNGAGYITSASLPGSFSGTSAGLVPESTIPSAERSKYFLSASGSWTDIMTTINGKAASSHTHGIGSIVDPYRWWNNNGENHTTRTDFNSDYNFGWRFIQANTNGPSWNGSAQNYSVYVGLGNDYNSGQYGMQIAYPRDVVSPYISIRYKENTAWGSWRKISAGYADSAGAVSWDNVSGKPSLASLNGSSSQDFYVDDLYYDAWIRNHTNTNGLYWSTTGWHLYPKDGDDFLFRSGSTGSAAMRFMTSGTERNYLYCNSSNEVGFLDTGRSWIFRVYNNGNVVATGDITAYSDARLKENVKPIEGALDKVMKLQGVTYTRNDSEDKSTKIGFIAQEVKEVVPEVVSISPDELAGLDDRHSLDYGKMVALLTEALKDQQKQIEELKAKLDGLTN